MHDNIETEPCTWSQWKSKHGQFAIFLAFEWLSEWVVFWSKKWEFVKLLELAGKFTVLVAAVSWILESGDRERARQEAVKAQHYRAWGLINAARGSTGDAGRRDAIIDLYKDNVSLQGAPLYDVMMDGINIANINFTNAILTKASFQGSCLKNARFRGANLAKANFLSAILIKTDLTDANLSDSNLNWAKMTGSILNGTNLRGANLRKANLNGAYLGRLDLENVNLTEADLTDAEISDSVDLSKATLCRTKMPDGNLNSVSCPEEATASIPDDVPDKIDCSYNVE